jgi:hypothetical protein
MNPRGKRKVKSHGLIFIQVKKMIAEGHNHTQVDSSVMMYRDTTFDPINDYPEGPELSRETMMNRLKFLASDEAKPIREMVVKKHCNPDLCLWNRHTMGKGAKMSINQLVKEKGWTWEELKMEGLRWYDNSHGSRMGHDWDDIVQLALAWSACN